MEPGDGGGSFTPEFPQFLPQGGASLLWLTWIMTYPGRENRKGKGAQAHAGDFRHIWPSAWQCWSKGYQGGSRSRS